MHVKGDTEIDAVAADREVDAGDFIAVRDARFDPSAWMIFYGVELTRSFSNFLRIGPGEVSGEIDIYHISNAWTLGGGGANQVWVLQL